MIEPRPWPPELLARVIKAMCPEQVCRTCGEPRRRIVGDVEYVDPDTGRPAHLKPDTWRRQRNVLGFSVNQSGGSGYRQAAVRQAPTLGFSDCGHNDWRPGIVLDPFSEDGTTEAVSNALGRDAIGIE